MKQNIKIGKDFSVVILAAGKSERIGFPKLSLKFDECFTFLECIVNEYIKSKCAEIAIVVNEKGKSYLVNNKITFPACVKVVMNEHPEWHRFYSLKLGVKSLIENLPVFIHNVDNPFVNQEILNELLLNEEKADYIIPEYKGRGGHPVLISDNIVNDIDTIKENKLHLKEFLNQYTKLKIPVKDDKVLVNINTLDEYKRHFNF